MPKLIPQEVQMKAMNLYLEGNLSAAKIAEKVSTDFNVSVNLLLYMLGQSDLVGMIKKVRLVLMLWQ